jgi:hypothetical protein
MAHEFGLVRVEGKQKILGSSTGTEWEIEGKGVTTRDKEFVIVECRRYTTSRLKQECVGALAYRISDTGASGGILVTPIGLQEGAKMVAACENIVTVILDENFANGHPLGLTEGSR